MGNNNSTENQDIDNNRCSSSEEIPSKTKGTLNFSGIYSAKSMTKKNAEPSSKENINGFAKQVHPSGNVYIGEFKNGMRHGQGKVIYNNGTVEEGWFENGTFKGVQYNKLGDPPATVSTDFLKQPSAKNLSKQNNNEASSL